MKPLKLPSEGYSEPVSHYLARIPFLSDAEFEKARALRTQSAFYADGFSSGVMMFATGIALTVFAMQLPFQVDLAKPPAVFILWVLSTWGAYNLLHRGQRLVRNAFFWAKSPKVFTVAEITKIKLEEFLGFLGPSSIKPVVKLREDSPEKEIEAVFEPDAKPGKYAPAASLPHEAWVVYPYQDPRSVKVLGLKKPEEPT